jgi:hypothetical protein
MSLALEGAICGRDLMNRPMLRNHWQANFELEVPSSQEARLNMLPVGMQNRWLVQA